MSGKEWKLKPETELRCEIPENCSLSMKLTEGTAEIFGVELAANKEYIFKEQNIAIFTWYGCKLEVSGEGSSIYESESTPMTAYVNTHIQLEARRDVAMANKDIGPRVLIVGPMDHGKSTCARILASYAVRMDRNPVLVDLDVGQSSCCIPGCITAASLDKSNLNLEDGFTNLTPLVYFHGHTSPKDNLDLYKTLVSNVAARVTDRLQRDADAKASGVIINTCGWVDGDGFSLLVHIVEAFKADIVLVMGHDKLYSSLLSTLGGQGPGKATVVKLPKSGGVVNRDANTRKRQARQRVKEYFYGRAAPAANVTVPGQFGVPPPLAPLVTTLFSPERREAIPLSTFNFFRITSANSNVKITEGMKALGSSASSAAGASGTALSGASALRLVRVNPTSDLTYSVVAVLHNVESSLLNSLTAAGGSNSAPGPSEQEMSRFLQNNVAGFVSIVSLDLDRGVMTILSPCPGALPSNNLLIGSVKWMEM